MLLNILLLLVLPLKRLGSSKICIKTFTYTVIGSVLKSIKRLDSEFIFVTIKCVCVFTDPCNNQMLLVAIQQYPSLALCFGSFYAHLILRAERYSISYIMFLDFAGLYILYSASWKEGILA